jgi:hypothetical protein
MAHNDGGKMFFPGQPDDLLTDLAFRDAHFNGDRNSEGLEDFFSFLQDRQDFPFPVALENPLPILVLIHAGYPQIDILDMPGQVTAADDLQQGQTGYCFPAGFTQAGGHLQGILG